MAKLGYPMPDHALELDPETMRRLGYRVIDTIVERISGLDADVAWRGATREEMERRLREPPPDGPTDPDLVLDRLLTDVLPFTGKNDHPRAFAFIPGCPTWPGILADMLAAGFNVFQGTWLASAGPTQVELVVLDWFKEWIGYPTSAAGALVSGGSVANLTALVCARAALAGAHADDLVVYVSDQTHSSMERSARTLGFRPDRVRVLPTDDAFRLAPETLDRAIREDREAGLRPLFACASAGATSTGAVDPLRELAEVCAEHGVWYHVDGAYGGFSVLTARGRQLLKGIERADSITLDPHKWLFQPYEAGCILVREGARLPRTFSMFADYLQDVAPDDDAPAELREVNFGDYGIQLTRCSRALKIWTSLKVFGVERFRAAIDNAFDLAAHAERRIRESDRFELLSPASLGVVCFRRVPPAGAAMDESELEDLNAAFVRGLLESGLGMISSTRIHGRYALRMCILNHRTRKEDVDRVLDWLEKGQPSR